MSEAPRYPKSHDRWLRHSTWSGVATYAETKGGGGHGGRSQLFSQGTVARSADHFDPTGSSFTLGHAAPVAGASMWSGGERISVSRPHGFTNRMTAEEIEMSVQQSPGGSASGLSLGKTRRVSEGEEVEEEEDVIETPTTATTKVGDPYDVETASTEHLTPKEAQEEFKRGRAF